MKRILTVLILLSSAVFGQTTILGPGDIAIVGFNFDNPDEFAFVLLKDINIGTPINFTDNGWKSDNTFRANEGIVIWIAPSGGLSSGQVITIKKDGGWTTSEGSVTSSGSFSLSGTGDQILAFQGTESSPIFIYAINSEGTGWQTDATSANESALPLGLVNGYSASAINEIDNAIYTGSTNQEPVALLSLVGNTANWAGSNTTLQTMPSGLWALPVELTTFTASIVNNNVELNWETATEVNNYGFEVERKIEEGEWSKLDFVNGHGNSNSTKFYSYSDKLVETAGKYIYRLKQIDIDGKFEYSHQVEANIGAPDKFELNQNYPNPFNPNTTISFLIPEVGTSKDLSVRLNVFNVLGEEVAELLNDNISAGYHSVNFNASHLNSGIYFYKLETNNFTQIRKMILVK